MAQELPILEEQQGPFFVRIDSQPYACDEDYYANLKLSDINNGIQQCKDASSSIVNGKKCNIVSKSQQCEKIRKQYKQLQVNLNKNATKVHEILDLLYQCHMEASLRYKHRLECTCVADKGHMHRINLLTRKCFSLSKELAVRMGIKDCSWGETVFIAWSDSHITYPHYNFAGILYSCRVSKLDKKISDEVFNSLNRLMMSVWNLAKNRQITANGTLTFANIDRFGWLGKEFEKCSHLQKQVHKDIQHYIIAGPAFEEADNCIIYSGKDIIGVHFDKVKVAKSYLRDAKIKVDSDFVLTLFEKQPVGVYKNCIETLRRHKPHDVKKLCEILESLNDDVKDAVIDYCEANDPTGEIGTEIARADANGTSKTWAKLLKKSGAKVTGDLIKDVQNMSLDQAKRFMKLVLQMFETKIKKRKISFEDDA